MNITAENLPMLAKKQAFAMRANDLLQGNLALVCELFTLIRDMDESQLLSDTTANTAKRIFCALDDTGVSLETLITEIKQEMDS
ncbi:MAG: hypothetical protein SOR95_08170 [Sutterella sp.]|nr:hypothetical protein [Sutterella sp.]